MSGPGKGGVVKVYEVLTRDRQCFVVVVDVVVAVDRSRTKQVKCDGEMSREVRGDCDLEEKKKEMSERKHIFKRDDR